MKKVISVSRRTDMVAFFPAQLASAFKREKMQVLGPSGHIYNVNLDPDRVHTIVLWSKNFSNLIENRHNLLSIIRKYDQLYLHFTITGLGGSFIEGEVPPPELALKQLDPLIEITGSVERICIRFDPIVYWKEGRNIKTNLYYFEKLAPEIKSRSIGDIRLSFAQWYKKAKRRAKKKEFIFLDPEIEKKKEDACFIASIARKWNLNLYSCSQNFLTVLDRIQPSSCINGFKLQEMHPNKEPLSKKKDRTQRHECLCTESTDIGSYSYSCPHSCIYCYANPR
jgi:DNA repair photolyase